MLCSSWNVLNLISFRSPSPFYTLYLGGAENFSGSWGALQGIDTANFCVGSMFGHRIYPLATNFEGRVSDDVSYPHLVG